MKRFILLSLSLFMLLAGSLMAQEKFTSYDNTYVKKTFDISIAQKSNDNFSLYIEVLSLDRLIDLGGIRVSHRQHPEFIEALQLARNKYSQWVATAKENNVQEVSKDMGIKAKVSGFFYSGRWHFQEVVPLSFEFRVMPDPAKPDQTSYLLMVRTGKLQSSSNRFTDADDFVLVFSDAEEIQEFIDMISLDKIQAFNQKPKAEDLFE